MTDKRFEYSVFTKPWKMPGPELARFVHDLGFDGIELPVRPGFQVEPERVGQDLPVVADQLAGCGVRIFSVAAPADEPTIAACGALNIPFVRVMVDIPRDEGYLEAVAEAQREYDRLVPLLEEHGVALGVQNHCGRYVPHAMGLWHCIAKYDPKHVAAVWDAAHEAIGGAEPELAIDMVWSHLRMVNLKNAYWRRRSGPEAEDVEWGSYWTNGRQGLASWPRIAQELKRRDWRGIVCLTAEYSDHDHADRLIAHDVAYAKSLLDD